MSRSVWAALDASQEARLRSAQPGCCLCGKAFTSGRPACLDHNHRTGLIRGLLCQFCNRTLWEDSTWLRRAADYLDNPPAVGVIGAVYVEGSPGAVGALSEEVIR